MHTIIYKRTATTQELYGILELQKRNVSSAISKEEKLKEGFVTVHHDFKVLKEMDDACSHIIATHNNGANLYR